jgi:hypothetical protein
MIQRFRFPILIALLAFITTSCASLSLDNLTDDEPPIERNIFTNLPGKNQEVIAVKFDDTSSARPQQGVEFADIVFITQVEAGLTRLMGIYSSNYPEVLGPVRSARISDLDILAQFGKVGFLYSGAQSKLRPLISAANLVNLSAERNPPSIYFNAVDRRSPFSMMVKPNLLLEKSEPLTLATSIGYEHGKRSEGSKLISSAKIKWPNSSYEALWNKAEKRFFLKHNNKDNFSTSGAILGSPMMVIQKVEITPSQFGDKFGGITPKSKVIGSGTGYLLRNGSVIEVNWSRESATSVTKWTLRDGSPAFFESGQVWFFLTDQEPEFTYRGKDANLDRPGDATDS